MFVHRPDLHQSFDEYPAHPSTDRPTVTFAQSDSMTSGVNVCYLPSETPASSDVKFSPSAYGDGSEDEDYSASLSVVLRQRRASVRRSRKGRARRPSSPFIPDDARSRRRSSVFTTSSGDTAISIEEVQPTIVTQEQIFENIHLNKEILGSVKQQPLGMRRKLKLVHQAKSYIKCHEGQLQERLAQSKSTRDIYARFNILIATKWQQWKREAANMSNLLIPWELRIKEIESHFGSVVASYFTFLRWLFWVNLVIAFILLVFVIIPEYLTGNVKQDGERKVIMEEERRNATNLLTLWEFEGVLKCSPIFYGYYSNIERAEYRMPLAYFLTGLVVYIYSFVAILRKMAENSRMSKLSEKDDECIFSWKLFTGWDYMIGNTETAHNRIASVILGFKEALLEEAEKKKDMRNWRIIFPRVLVNLAVFFLLALSAYAVISVVSDSDNAPKESGWWKENETTIVVTLISILFPLSFEALGLLEHYHPRQQLRVQLARIMFLNLLNLYSLIFALFSKISGMSNELMSLKPNVTISNETTISQLTFSTICYEEQVSCSPCNFILPISATENDMSHIKSLDVLSDLYSLPLVGNSQNLTGENLRKSREVNSDNKNLFSDNSVTVNTNISLLLLSANNEELNRLRNISNMTNIYNSNEDDDNNTFNKIDDYEFYQKSSKPVELTTENISSDVNEFNELGITEKEHTDEFTVSTNLEELDIQSDDISTVDNNWSTLDEKKIHDISSTDSYSYDTPVFDTKSPIIENEIPTRTTTLSHNLDDNTSSSLETTNSPFVIDSLATYTSSHSESTSYDINFHYTSTEYSESSNSTLTNRPQKNINICPIRTFNCTVKCGEQNMTMKTIIINCTMVKHTCFIKKCNYSKIKVRTDTKRVAEDSVYIDENNVKIYNLTVETRKKLLKLCWETMFGQELVKLTMMDLVFVVLLGTLIMDFLRAFIVRYLNRCWCWDLEKRFPEYGDFKIAENILHLINNQGMVWMGMFFSPGLVVINVFKLVIMMYLRSWAVMTCNVPHKVIFRVSKSNNFYLALLLAMLFLCVLPVGYSIVCVKPSWHCGPFSEYEKIYHILTNKIYTIFPDRITFILEYIASPAIVIPLLVLLILIIYYLISLTNSLREANTDLKIQLRRERTEERRKVFQIADTRRRTGNSAIDNTPFGRWKRALPSLPFSKSIDSDDRKTITGDETIEIQKSTKKKGGIFAKVVSMALETKTNPGDIQDFANTENPSDELDTDFHEAVPKDMLKLKDISIVKNINKDKKKIEFKTEETENSFPEIKADEQKSRFKHKNEGLLFQDQIMMENEKSDTTAEKNISTVLNTALDVKASSESLVVASNEKVASIPVITVSTTESDDDSNQSKAIHTSEPSKVLSSKELQRQCCIDSRPDNKTMEFQKDL